MKNITLVKGIMMGAALSVPAAWAGSLTIPNTFSSGQKALASEVNANFSAVKTEVDDNDARITTNAAGIATNKTAVDLNTAHRTGDGSDHADVAANSTAISNNATAISANTTHRQGNGSDHANVAANSTAISNNTSAISQNTTHRTSDGKDHGDVVLNNTHRTSDGKDHSDVVLNNSHRTGDGSDHADVAANTTAIAGLTGYPSALPCQGNDANDIMVRVGPLCVDKYEASAWNDPGGSGAGATQYGAASDDYPVNCADNANGCTGADSIFARSEAGVKPSAYITWFQANQACLASGKRLLTNAEWQMAAAGTDKANCNVSGAASANTDANASCVSNWGVVNMVGNVNEWVADWMQGIQADQWVVTEQTNTTNVTINSPIYNSGDLGAAYDNDVAAGTQRSTGNGGPENFPGAVYRGGGFGGGGVFTFNATFAPSYSAEPVGFRCAR